MRIMQVKKLLDFCYQLVTDQSFLGFFAHIHLRFQLANPNNKEPRVLFIRELNRLIDASATVDNIPNTTLIALLLKHPDDYLYSVLIWGLKKMRLEIEWSKFSSKSHTEPDNDTAEAIYKILNFIYQQEPQHWTEKI